MGIGELRPPRLNFNLFSLKNSVHGCCFFSSKYSNLFRIVIHMIKWIYVEFWKNKSGWAGIHAYHVDQVNEKHIASPNWKIQIRRDLYGPERALHLFGYFESHPSSYRRRPKNYSWGEFAQFLKSRLQTSHREVVRSWSQEKKIFSKVLFDFDGGKSESSPSCPSVAPFSPMGSFGYGQSSHQVMEDP
jgi:hypothetical protein